LVCALEITENNKNAAKNNGFGFVIFILDNLKGNGN